MRLPRFATSGALACLLAPLVGRCVTAASEAPAGELQLSAAGSPAVKRYLLRVHY